MSHTTRVLSANSQTVFVDKYGGATFYAYELAKLVAEMLSTDTKENIELFCERFEEK